MTFYIEDDRSWQKTEDSRRRTYQWNMPEEKRERLWQINMENAQRVEESNSKVKVPYPVFGKPCCRACSTNIGPPNAAAQCCIPQVNNQHCRVVQRRNAAYAFVSLLLVLLAPRKLWLSLACPSRCLEIFSFASLSLSLVCLRLYPFLSLSLVTAGRAALCLFLPIACSTRSKEMLSLTCLTLLLVLLAPNFYLMHSASPPPLFSAC
jgi:hypothetical protein